MGRMVMKGKDDPRQLQLNFDMDMSNLVQTQTRTKDVKAQEETESASVINFDTKIRQKNNLELKQLYVEILKNVEHIK